MKHPPHDTQLQPGRDYQTVEGGADVAASATVRATAREMAQHSINTVAAMVQGKSYSPEVIATLLGAMAKGHRRAADIIERQAVAELLRLNKRGDPR